MSQKIKSFTNLLAWQEAHKLVLLIYKETIKFPKEERYGLTDQIRRAVVSVSSNIAEGFSRINTKEKKQFYYMSLGSLTEVQNQLLIARDVGYINREIFNNLAQQTVSASKMLNSLIRYFKNNTP